MRIVYLNPSGQMGGAETSLRDILAGVRNAQPDSKLFLVLGEDGPLRGQAQELGVEVTVAPFPPALARLGENGSGSLLGSLVAASWAIARYALGLSRILDSIQPDIIHSNGFKMHVLAACLGPRERVIWHIHDYVSSRRLMRRLLGWLSGRCRLAIANSRSVAADLNKLMPGLHVVAIHNAVDLERFTPLGPRADLDRLAGLEPAAPGTIRVGLVATFAHWKGHKVFLEALSLLPAGLKVRGYVIGGPIYQTTGSQVTMDELEQEARRLGLGERCGFTGFVSDTALVMRSLDVVVHASTQPEPFGMVIIEAMACGKPVIVSNAGGATELFEEGITALGHAPGNARELAAQIERLAADAMLRARLGERSRSSAERSFGRERMTRELTAVYGECSGGARRAQALVPSLNS